MPPIITQVIGRVNTKVIHISDEIKFMETIGQRLKRLREGKNLSQSALAKLADLKSQGTIGNIERDTRGYGESIVDIARVLNVTPDYLRCLPGTKETAQAASTHPSGHFGTAVGVLDKDDALPEGYIQIPESEVRFAAGNGCEVLFDEAQASVPRAYRRDWFVREGINPMQARCFKVHGESMENLLADGDTVLVNLAETSVINGRVYALRYGNELRIKRVYRKLDGGLVLHSDNPAFVPRDEDVPPGVVRDHIGIIGRVRDKSGKGGL